MVETHGRKLNGIEYHDYVLMVAALDTEWTRNPATAGEVFDDDFKSFQDTCLKFREGIIQHENKWAEISGRQVNGMPEYLFKLKGWIPCGHPDALCLALVDDLDAVQTVVETYPKTVEELTVAFCPKVSHYAQDLRMEDRACFIEPHDCFTEANNRLFEEVPMLQFARLKLQGVLTLGRALPVLEVAYRVFAERIVEALKLLKAWTSPLYDSEKDLNGLKICFLDLQEEEEIGIVFFTSNLTVSMSVLSYLQATTITDLFQHWQGVATHLDKTDHYQSIRDFAREGLGENAPPKADEKELLEIISGSHVLRWTRSTVAFSHSSDGNPTHLQGWADPSIAINHPPGHQQGLEKLLGDLFQSLYPEDQEERESRQNARPNPESYRLHVAGPIDYFAELATGYHVSEPFTGSTEIILNRGRGLIPIAAMRRLWLEIPGALKRAMEPSPNSSGRDLSGWTTSLAIPVPIIKHGAIDDVFHPAVADGHCALIKQILEQLRSTVFLTKWEGDPKTRTQYGTEPIPNWPICLSELRMKTRISGLPFETRRTLIVLYENFASILASPLSFDIVLDLYDIMATLYLMLVDLPETPTSTVANANSHPKTYTPRMPDHKVDGLHAILDAVDSALDLRQRRLYPETRIRDWALDFRSNILQIILSAEAAMKCAVGIHRKFALDSEEIGANFGVIHQVSFAPSITVPRNAFGDTDSMPENGKPPRRLAQFRSGVSHLTQLNGFTDFFHESFHLVFDELVSFDVDKAIKKQCSDPIIEIQKYEGNHELEHLEAHPESIFERVTELYVHLSMMMFVYDGDWELALKAHAANYSTNLRSATSNVNQEGLIRFSTQFAPVMIAALVVEKARNTKPDLWWNGDIGPKVLPTLSESERFFKKALKVLKPWLADYAWLFEEAGDESLVEREKWVIATFQRAYLGTYDHLNLLWFRAKRVYWAYLYYTVTEFTAEAPKNPKNPPLMVDTATVEEFQTMCEILDTRLTNTLKDGNCYTPLSGAQTGRNIELNPEGKSFDAALVACRSLLFYWRFILDSDGTEKDTEVYRFLNRSGENGNISLDEVDGKIPARRLLDRTSTAYFCCTSEDRSRRSGVRIALFKTFWDISSRNRGRRFRTLLKQASLIRKTEAPNQ